MIRFYGEDRIVRRDLDAALSREPLRLDKKIWERGRERFRTAPMGDGGAFYIPVVNGQGETVCFAYQDNEANRELRMLKELSKAEGTLQFTDLFPTCGEVVLHGYNELAVSFAEYLKKLGISVWTDGEYWSSFGYRSVWKMEPAKRGRRMVLYAEGVACFEDGPENAVRRSVSPEFECVDQIYEKNVLEGKIRDAATDRDGFFRRLRERREILIMGTDREAQDVYDLLAANGIDILGFVSENAGQGELLGKRVLSLTEAVAALPGAVFLNCAGRYGALGEKWTEYFDYRGYERNRQYFLLRDYIADIPVSNLVHVLRGKRVLLAGDAALCGLLARYLERVEDSAVEAVCVPWGETAETRSGDLRFFVIPDYKNGGEPVFREEKMRQWKAALSAMNFRDYSEYFINCASFALIDLYLNDGTEKYSIPELRPKGILLGRIPGASGNVFFRGILDGHPEILLMDYSEFNNNLFYYCVRLAHLPSDEVLDRLQEMSEGEAREVRFLFSSWDEFVENAQKLLKLKGSFTSQELFVLFHIAYAEMAAGKQAEEISKRTVYWEPHFVDRNMFPFFALWLEDQTIYGQTIVLRRNNVVRTGSSCKRRSEGTGGNPYSTMFGDDRLCDKFQVTYCNWSEFKMRFEDLKLQPKEKLGEVCSRLEIAWSDSMLQTTKCGERPFAYRGSVDFDLKAVFNKYEDFLSEFDRFRISITSSLYLKRFGYDYENCLKLTRRELQELFLKPFLFEERLTFEEDHIRHTKNSEWFEWKLWDIRKRMLLDDITPEFGRVDLKQTGAARIKAYFQECFGGDVKAAVSYAEEHEKLVVYGTGCDCLGLLELMSEGTRRRVEYSDRKAAGAPYLFEGKNVLSPDELCGRYKDYYILVTSTMYRGQIEEQFDKMGIEPSRVFYNRAEFGML